MNTKKSFLISLIIIDIFIALFFVLIFALPWIVTWFVEFRHKDAGLPSLIMLVCYPCAPFVAAALFCLRRLVKNFIAGLIFGDKNIKMLMYTAISCAAITVLTFWAGGYYPPFYAIAFAAAGSGLIIKVIMDIFSAELNSRREELYESVKEEL